MDVGAVIGGYRRAESFIEIVDQGWLRANMDAALLEKWAEEPTATMQESLCFAGISLQVHDLEKLGDRVRHARHPLLLAEALPFRRALPERGVDREIDDGVCPATGFPESRRGHGQENAIGDEAEIRPRETVAGDGHKRSGIGMQQRFPAHEPNPGNVAEQLTEPLQVSLVLLDIRAEGSRYLAEVPASVALQVAVIGQVNFQVWQNPGCQGPQMPGRFLDNREHIRPHHLDHTAFPLFDPKKRMTPRPMSAPQAMPTPVVIS
jgi:hypothetical protein